MAFDPKKVYLSPAPHFSAGETTRGIMLKVVAALAPLCVCGVVLFGAPAAVTIAVSVAGCVGFETAFRKLSRQESRAGDLSAAVTGIMLALTLPPSTPAWMTLLGALFSVVVAKEFFGGLGANVFNPALTGRAFLLMSFPVALTTWTKPFDAVTGATLLPKLNAVGEFADAASGAAETVEASRLAYFIGNRAGCIGETSVLLILLAFLFLLATKVIDWRGPGAKYWGRAGVGARCGGEPFWARLWGGRFFGAVYS
ncbi:RnfABCDGE type electron transport complex subunit D [Treponema endosymbiont of Eucomonympha sp.]|uniref:RnfABCDGE type electron transport complex subunit D n=1 Tax=Treponema endosymbiont of Eucomonympha sp. TaxID=1580831 RepID=UPI0007513810|nr:RnfABCDGE type electron transport complex subunit D [Treponema endosymbiont of Eucomonympha sp.]